MARKLLLINVFVLPIPFLGLFFLEPGKVWSVFFGVLISAGSIQLSAWVIERFWESEWNRFNKIFFFSMFIRFFLVVGLLAILLGAAKIDEIFFTVSFIFSYLCYSITEMIFFNQILQKKSSRQ